MGLLKWLVSLAQTKPIIFGVALLLIGVFVGGRVVYYQQKRVEKLEAAYKESNDKCNQRLDSTIRYYERREDNLNAETKATLNAMIQDYQKQLKDQQNLNRRIDNTILNNARILREKQEQLKLISNDN